MKLRMFSSASLMLRTWAAMSACIFSIFVFAEARSRSLLSERIIKIDAALQSLYLKHLPITKAAIATEIGCSRQALQKEYITEYLEQHPIYSKRKGSLSDVEANHSVSFLQIELEKERQKRRKLETKLKQMAKQSDEQRNLLRELNKKYQKLLGRYQEDVGRKFIHL